MLVCPSASSSIDFTDSCVRRLWSSTPPALLVLVLVILSFSSFPVSLKRVLKSAIGPWSDFLTLEDAELYEFGGDGGHWNQEAVSVKSSPALSESFLLSAIAMLETAAWTVTAAYTFAYQRNNNTSIWDAVQAVTMAVIWIYAAVKPVILPHVGPPYDLLLLYFLLLAGQIIVVGGVLYDHAISASPLPSVTAVIAYSFDFVAISCVIVAVLRRPMAIPSSRIKALLSLHFRPLFLSQGKSVSPDDYTSLWGWISFTWLAPLIARGRLSTLNEADIPELSLTMRAKPVFLKFSEMKRKSLIRQIWAANSKDILVDVVLTYLSVVFTYAGPFFLKRIIDVIDNNKSNAADPSPGKRSQAYVYACLAFCSTVLAAECDLLHLWHGRRASVRVSAQLMSAIYDKALKRKDLSGVVDNKNASGSRERKNTSEETKDHDVEGDPKAGADVGKIVNLMSSDANRVAYVAAGGIYFICGTPFEFIIAATFLYQLLGWSAFAGFAVLILGWPLNSIVARQAVRIQKGASVARDERMGVLNEIIGAIKLIKYFAWEERWIRRALDAREYELRWLVKSRVNAIMFQAIWSTAPILVSVVSFSIFVAQGNELTLGIAFTSIALFGMMRVPLNEISSWAIYLLQTSVTVRRLETFLGEEEVDENVSSLKRTSIKKMSDANTSNNSLVHNRFGIEKGSFQWNAVGSTSGSITKGSDGKSMDGSPNLSGLSLESSDATATSSERNGSSSSIRTVIASNVAHSFPATHGSNREVFKLSDVSIVFPEGELTVVTGPTASGKTALLLALLGEMTLIPNEGGGERGKILFSKTPERMDDHGLVQSISYAAQSPWLQHRSIRDNILFGNDYDESRYMEVVECCALNPDLSYLEDGDQTEIGVRGVSLSGGQKARVALARAVYAPTKYVLLDDPLSAVDSHTARFLYERLFLGSLMQNRTIVLVTHHVELMLPSTYYLVRMVDGRINMQGTVRDLRSRGLLENVIIEAEAEARQDIQEAQHISPGQTEVDKEHDEPIKVINRKPKKLIEDEERAFGGVKWSIYRTYLKASSYWTWAILLLIVIIAQVLSFAEKYWVMVWGEAYGEASQEFVSDLLNHTISSVRIGQQAFISDGASISPEVFNPARNFTTFGLRDRFPLAEEKPLFYVAVYALIGFSYILVGVGSAIAQYTGAVRASRKLFKRLLHSVVYATFRWQDTTPIGRLLNRFSKDMETIDSSLANSLQTVNSSLANFLSSVIVVVAVFPYFSIPIIIFSYIYYYLAIGYLNTGRDLRRMEATSRSPIFSGFGELLEGVVTVRAFSAERRFMNSFYKKVDLTMRMYYTFWMMNRWLLLRFDCLGGLAVFTTTMFALSGLVDAGWAALSITSAITFSTNIYWACRYWTQLELDLNSVERIVEYLDLPQEPPAVIKESRPPAHWPSSTGPNEDSLLVVENLTVRYAPELPAVLHDISFSLKGRERVGLLGRTGSGKSTLATSILRFVEPSEGRIMVDGIDISKIGLHDLRSRVTFIPQDATLFSGTLRDNLDPFDEYTDEECLAALYRVHMLTEQATSRQSLRTAAMASSTHDSETELPSTDFPEHSSSRTSPQVSNATPTISKEGHEQNARKITLQSEVSAGGLNFSAGQRQLITMARALLRQSTIIIFDEATSSIDFETDARIQTAIREEFGQSLLLTIAHRLRSVIDYDRLIVLDQGRIAEFDTPWNLLNREGGIFRGMCLKSGSYAELERVAKAKVLEK